LDAPTLKWREEAGFAKNVLLAEMVGAVVVRTLNSLEGSLIGYRRRLQSAHPCVKANGHDYPLRLAMAEMSEPATYLTTWRYSHALSP
jgi:hypothetical protein